MTELHITEFYKDTAQVLLALYQQFPRPVTLYVQDFAGPDTPDEFGLPSPRHLACLEAMVWLSHVGLIRYESLVRQEAMDRAALTQRAFLALTAPSLEAAQDPDGAPSWSSELRARVKAANSLALDAGVRAFLEASRRYT